VCGVAGAELGRVASGAEAEEEEEEEKEEEEEEEEERRRRRKRKVHSKLTQGTERWTPSATALPRCAAGAFCPRVDPRRRRRRRRGYS